MEPFHPKKQSVVYILINVLLLLPLALGDKLVVHERRDKPLQDAIERQRIEPDAVLSMRIGLQQNHDALAQAESWLMAVSQPDSPKYGQHWNQNDVINAFKPTDETVRAVYDWLLSHDVLNFTHSDNRLWLAFDMPAERAEKMLNTKYFEHRLPDGRSEVSADQYLLPKSLQAHVDFVKPGIKGSDVTGRTSRSRAWLRKAALESPTSTTDDTPRRSISDPIDPNSLEHCNQTVTPACIRALYNIPVTNPNRPVSRNNDMGIFSAHILWWQGELDKFLGAYTDIPTGTSPIFKPIDGGHPPPSGTPPATDVGWENQPIWRQVQGETTLDLERAMPIVYPQNVTVFQTDDQYWSKRNDQDNHGGIFNTFLDALDGSYCTYSAYHETGNDPKLDPVYPDTHRPNGYKGQLQCGVFRPTNVITSSFGTFWETDLPAAYLKRQCNEWLKLGLQGVSVFMASGDEGTGKCMDHGRVFQLSGVTCPWITSVGATRVPWHGTVFDAEKGADFSAGGFSLVYDAPAYQKTAISKYFQRTSTSYEYFYDGKYNESSGRYNRNGRGIPDIAACGKRDLTYNQETFYKDTAGTSHSSPIVAAIFNRINEERIRAGKGPVGFINPVLYRIPGGLNDIVEGQNPGDPFVDYHCGKHAGFDAVEGWDPVTGMGTPNYPKLLEVFVNLP